MKLYVDYEAEKELDFDYRETAMQVGQDVLEAEQFPGEAEVNLSLTSDAEIHRVNREFRDIDAPTDVLSFPAIFFDVPGDFREMLENEIIYKNPDTGHMMLGDIMISIPRVFDQASAYGHSVKREFAFLFAHSMLHLLGYDHIKPEEAKVMEAKQENALESLGIHR